VPRSDLVTMLADEIRKMHAEAFDS
jgi:hypothetical protein